MMTKHTVKYFLTLKYKASVLVGSSADAIPLVCRAECSLTRRQQSWKHDVTRKQEHALFHQCNFFLLALTGFRAVKLSCQNESCFRPSALICIENGRAHHFRQHKQGRSLASISHPRFSSLPCPLLSG